MSSKFWQKNEYLPFRESTRSLEGALTRDIAFLLPDIVDLWQHGLYGPVCVTYLLPLYIARAKSGNVTLAERLFQLYVVFQRSEHGVPDVLHQYVAGRFAELSVFLRRVSQGKGTRSTAIAKALLLSRRTVSKRGGRKSFRGRHKSTTSAEGDIIAALQVASRLRSASSTSLDQAVSQLKEENRFSGGAAFNRAHETVTKSTRPLNNIAKLAWEFAEQFNRPGNEALRANAELIQKLARGQTIRVPLS